MVDITNKLNASREEVSTHANAGDSQLAGGNIWPLSSQDNASTSASNNNVPSGTVIIRADGRLYTLSPLASGTITALDPEAGTATIGGVDVELSGIDKVAKTVAIAKTLNVGVGGIIVITERGNTPFVVVPPETNNEIDVIAMDNGYSLTIYNDNDVNINAFGVTTGADSTANMQAAFDRIPSGGRLFGKGDFRIDGTATRNSPIKWDCDGTEMESLTPTTSIRIEPNFVDVVVASVSSTVESSATYTLPTELQGVVQVGCVMELKSNEVSHPSNDGDYMKGQLVKVLSIDGNTVEVYPRWIDSFTVDNARIYDPFEAPYVKNLVINARQNNNSSTCLVLRGTEVDVENLTIYGSKTQNVGAAIAGVTLKMSHIYADGIENGYQALGYGFDVHGSDIQVNSVSGTRCRHVFDGSSRESYMVGLTVDGVNVSKGKDASPFLYAFGMHANVRQYSASNITLTGTGRLMAIRNGEGNFNNITTNQVGANNYYDIEIFEEGCRGININGVNANGGSSVVFRLSTDGENENLNISGVTSDSTDKTMLLINNRGFDHKKITVSEISGDFDFLIRDENSNADPATALELDIASNIKTQSQSGATGFHIGLSEDYTDLSVSISDVETSKYNNGGYFGITGNISGKLKVKFLNSEAVDTLIDAIVLTPASVNELDVVDISGNNLDGKIILNIPATIKDRPLRIERNKLLGRDDPLEIQNSDLPILIRDNSTDDSLNWRFVQTTLPEAMRGNINTGGVVSANGYQNNSIVQNAQGEWLSPSAPPALTYYGIDFIRQRTFAVGQPKGWALAAGSWVSIGNL